MSVSNNFLFTKKDSKQDTVTITEAAYNEIMKIIEQQEKSDLHVRLYVQTTRTGGLGYGMALDQQHMPDDWSIEQDDLKIVVDNVSKPYVIGATVDFETGEQSGFKISNPFVDLSAANSCGSCGSASSCSGSC